ncbi:MAG: HEAT repeat domain-containing protein [Gemmatimonadales bacterium]|nr:HEAT repeat domain-containing protein [Gemmatimonadales bacterium]
MTRDEFEERFGDLVASFRIGTTAAALREEADQLAAELAAAGVRYETGFELSGEGMEQAILKTRCFARLVDAIDVRPGVEGEALLALAEALASDELPIIETNAVRLVYTPLMRTTAEMLAAVRLEKSRREQSDRRLSRDRRQQVAPYQSPDRRRQERRTAGERRSEEAKRRREQAKALLERVKEAAKHGDWPLLVHSATELAELAPQLPPDDRRAATLQLRKALDRRVIEQLVDLGARVEPERRPVLRLCRWLGLEGAQVLIDLLVASDPPGPRRYVFDGVAAMPEAYPLLLPLFQRQGHAVRVAADLVALMGNARALDPLERVLTAPDPRTRVAAARAMAQLRGTQFARQLADAFRHEEDPAAWRGIAEALAMLGGREPIEALLEVALEGRPLLGTPRYADEQQVAVVEALRAAKAPGVKAALARIAKEGSGAARDAASAAVAGGGTGR